MALLWHPGDLTSSRGSTTIAPVRRTTT